MIEPVLKLPRKIICPNCNDFRPLIKAKQFYNIGYGRCLGCKYRIELRFVGNLWEVKPKDE